MQQSDGGSPSEDPREAVVGPLDLEAHVDEALAVQAVAFGLTDDEVGVRRHIVLRHLGCPGARALGATNSEGRLVGFVYGMPNDRTQWWSTVVTGHLRASGHEDWLDDSFVITELHVHPLYQQRGIGRRLITVLTDDADEPRSLLSAIDTDSPARALYRKLGYEDLARDVHFPSAMSPYAVMGRGFRSAGTDRRTGGRGARIAFPCRVRCPDSLLPSHFAHRTENSMAARVQRLSRSMLKTLRDDPADAETLSHKLLVRAGYVRRAAAGIWTWLPLGLQVLENVTRVVREEMDAPARRRCCSPRCCRRSRTRSPAATRSTATCCSV